MVVLCKDGKQREEFTFSHFMCFYRFNCYQIMKTSINVFQDAFETPFLTVLLIPHGIKSAYICLGSKSAQYYHGSEPLEEYGFK